MEEILASIRKIISEDSTEQQPQPVAEPPRPAPVAAPVMTADADVLELTQEVEEVPPMPVVEPIRQAAPPPPPPEQDVVFETIEEPVVEEEVPAEPEGIFSEEHRTALAQTFANITPTQAPAPAMARPPVELSGATDGASVQAVFEHAVRTAFEPVVNQWLATNADAIVERMKPLIQEWMNEHFAALLRDMVRDELTRTEHMKPLIYGRLDERFPEILGAVRSEVERVAKSSFGKR